MSKINTECQPGNQSSESLELFTLEEQTLIDKVLESKKGGYKVKQPSSFSLLTEEGCRCYCLASLIRSELEIFREPRRALELKCYSEISLLAQRVVKQYFASQFQRVVASFVFSYDGSSPERDTTEVQTVKGLLKLL